MTSKANYRALGSYTSEEVILKIPSVNLTYLLNNHKLGLQTGLIKGKNKLSTLILNANILKHQKRPNISVCK
jgi:hypothetical protein